MTARIDLLSATQLAFYRALEACVEKAAVYDHVKQDTQPNFVKLGAIDGINEGSKAEPLERFEVEIQSIYRGTDRGELLAIMNEVRGLDDVELQADGVTFSRPLFLAEAASDAAHDGITYAGITTYEVFAEPA